MHSYHGQSINIHFNGDLSGEVIFQDKGIIDKNIRVDVEDIINLLRNNGYIVLSEKRLLGFAKVCREDF